MRNENTSTDSLGWDMGILLVLVGVLVFVHNLSAVGNPFGFLPLILTALGAGQLMNYEQEKEVRR